LEELGGIWNEAEMGAKNRIQIRCGLKNWTWFEAEHPRRQRMSRMIEA
jgi:hypothetical protein